MDAPAFINDNLQIIFLVMARVMGLIQVTPMIVGSGIPFAARAGLALFVATAIAPVVAAAGYPIPSSGLLYVMLLASEALIGVIMGFFVSVIFSVLSGAGQMFSVQMGFGASEMFDPTTGAEMPVMGRTLNMAAFLVFFFTFGLQKLFLYGIMGSFRYFTAASLVWNPEGVAQAMVKGLALLFSQSIIVAMPLIGALFLVSVTMGLLARASPQMNLMMVGFPIQLSIGFIMLIIALPAMMNAFNGVLDHMWQDLGRLIVAMREGAPS